MTRATLNEFLAALANASMKPDIVLAERLKEPLSMCRRQVNALRGAYSGVNQLDTDTLAALLGVE